MTISESQGGSPSETRATAGRVAKILREKGRSDDAVAILSALAAAFGNDEEGQALLAEAFRIEPNSPLARMAFERMEGIAGAHEELDAAIGRYSQSELVKLEKALRPVFFRAQVGFNNNVKHKGVEYHVQTEDSGLDKPHIITHLFADGGRIIKSHKRSYAGEVKRDDVTHFVRALMKGQHMEMVLALREGRFDEILAGRAAGGAVEVLDHPPKVDLEQVARRGANQSKAKRPESAPDAQPSVAAASADVLRARLHLMRSLHGGPDYFDVIGNNAILGISGQIRLDGEKFCHPREAAILFDGTSHFVQDIEGGNGVFIRIRARVEIALLDEFIVGDQLLRLERNPEADDSPDPGPTYFRSSLKWPSAFRVVHLFEGGAIGATSMARGTTLQIGSAKDYANDLVFRSDPLVSAFHCVIEEQADSFILSDLGAKSGVFVRVSGKQQLSHGSEILIGRTRLLVDLSPSHPELAPLG